MSLLAPLFAAALLVAIQGPLLRAACAVTGERPPGYGEALVTTLLAAGVAGLCTVSWSCTFGLVVGLLSHTLAWVLSVFVGLAVTAAVYARRLELSGPAAFAVTLAHHAMAWAVSAVLWGALAWLG